MTGQPIAVGYVMKAHGIRGEVLVKVLSDDPERFTPGTVLTTDIGPASVTVERVRRHTRGLVISFAEVADRNAAEALTKTTLMIDTQLRRSLGRDEYWPVDLVGLEAVDGSGAVLGVVDDVVSGEAQDRLVIATRGGVFVEVPFVAALVEPPADGSIVIRPPEGLFPEAGADDHSG